MSLMWCVDTISRQSSADPLKLFKGQPYTSWEAWEATENRHRTQFVHRTARNCNYFTKDKFGLRPLKLAPLHPRHHLHHRWSGLQALYTVTAIIPLYVCIHLMVWNGFVSITSIIRYNWKLYPQTANLKAFNFLNTLKLGRYTIIYISIIIYPTEQQKHLFLWGKSSFIHSSSSTTVAPVASMVWCVVQSRWIREREGDPTGEQLMWITTNGSRFRPAMPILFNYRLDVSTYLTYNWTDQWQRCLLATCLDATNWGNNAFIFQHVLAGAVVLESDVSSCRRWLSIHGTKRCIADKLLVFLFR